MFKLASLPYIALFVADLCLASAIIVMDVVDTSAFSVDGFGLAALMLWMHRNEQRDRKRHRIVQPYGNGWFWPHFCLPLGLAVALAFPRLDDLGGRAMLVSGAFWFAWWGARLRYHFPLATRSRKSGFWLLLLACASLTRSPLAIAVVAALAATILLIIGPEKTESDAR